MTRKLFCSLVTLFLFTASIALACMQANAVQQFLKQANDDIWPRNSSDLNVAQNIGAILKDEVEAKMLAEIGPGRYSYQTLPKNVENIEKCRKSTQSVCCFIMFIPRSFESCFCRWWKAHHHHEFSPSRQVLGSQTLHLSLSSAVLFILS